MVEETRFKALVVDEEDGRYVGELRERRMEDLPPGDLLVRVSYSSLNYKDALSAAGNRGVTPKYPHTPGIDAAGVAVSCDSEVFLVGEEVLITGWDLGMSRDGGFSEYLRVPSEWALPLPEGLSMRAAMALGTAGLTAGLCVQRLTELVAPEAGTIAVSGASGGVGSLCVSILSSLGYSVAAVTGKNGDRLATLGASEIIPRAALEAQDPKALLKARFAGAVDTVGGHILENLVKSTSSAVVCCGNAASAELSLTVYPFILRGISLIGIDSQHCPRPVRERIWNKLAGPWKPATLEADCSEISLEEVPQRLALMLEGRSSGRTVVRI